MLDWFKSGKALPKRYVWEIALGAHEHFLKEESLVDVHIPEGATIDVIGDVHGIYILTDLRTFSTLLTMLKASSMTCFICIHSQGNRAKVIIC